MNRTKAFKAIEKKIKRGDAPYPPSPTALPLKEITVFEPLFQTRSPSKEESGIHIRKLLRSIQRKGGKPLDPLKVFWTGQGWCCIDGHHRLAAYKKAIEVGQWEKEKPIPVQVFEGSLLEASTVGLQENGKDRLPMSDTEREDAAWAFVILDPGRKFSKETTAEKTGVSTSTIGNMRRVLKYFQTEHPLHDPADFRWWQARNLEQDREEGEGKDSATRRRETVERYARLMRKTFKESFTSDVSLMVEVIKEAYSIDYLPALSQAIANILAGDGEEALVEPAIEPCEEF